MPRNWFCLTNVIIFIVDIRVGYWYDVENIDGDVAIKRKTEEKYSARASPKICAWDIETTKPPLMFPDARNDCIMMISYMMNNQGYLIVNREIVSEDIEDFDYTPLPEYPGPFIIFNVADERELLVKWFEHLREEKPTIYVSYNGDNFDFPFVDTRARKYDMNIRDEIGYWKDVNNEYKSTYGSHMDLLNWVVRDSYLPQGSHGLKEVTRKLLGYNPIEIHPEEMVNCAKEDPQTLASYSVSDAVATYYLYKKYVEGFIFSLCNIIPMPPDEVLRKGSGTLCETLLMVSAFKANIICPNKYKSDPEKMYKGHLIDSESYIGGHVKALQSGVFRSDILQKFAVNADAYDTLIHGIDEVMNFEIGDKEVDEESVSSAKQSIIQALTRIKDNPNRIEKPKIFHLDVGAMYPNIILTNRLQPSSVVNESICASCIHNKPSTNCKRQLKWHSTVEFYTANKSEYNQIKRQLESETFPPILKDDPPRSFSNLSHEEQTEKIKERLGSHCRKAYKKIYEKSDSIKDATVCMRENPFYVDTVKAFRDKRVQLKDEQKKWKGILSKAETQDEIEFAKKMVVVSDSLQLAHKCILNSFYGYVMRKASRWYSMEMAGIVTYTGAQIIKVAHEFMSDIGTPLELDTDGIWCTIPASFPYNITYKLKNGQTCMFNYPCVILNSEVQAQFSNHQYQTLVNEEKRQYETSVENSIYFEVDGPYRAMILPASQKQGKGIAKKYAVFNEDESMAELKGFEIKRRGELQLIKLFQADLFKTFLKGGSLEECYAAVGAVANRYLDYLYSKGEHLEDEDLFKFISESSNMKKTLAEYGSTKSARTTTARRLAELFGDEIIRDKGLVCEYIVSAKPDSAPVSERCIPASVFRLSDTDRTLLFLKKWTKDASLVSTDIRGILDWKYYIERFGGTLQKLIVIPAIKQGLSNPIPRVAPPDWLAREVRENNDTRKQKTIDSMFSKKSDLIDLENLGDELSGEGSKPSVGPRVTKHKTMDIEVLLGAKRRRAGSNDDSETGGVSDQKKRKVPDPALKLHKEFTQADIQNISKLFTSEHYPVWLLKMKSRWRQMRERRRKKRDGRDPGPAIPPMIPSNTNTMASFLRKKTEAVKYNEWEIIKIQKTQTPGLFTLFALIDKSMHSINLKIPREIYVNYRKAPPQDDIGQEVKRILPRARPVYHLRKYYVDEEYYQNHFREKLEGLGHLIEGIYESQVPPIFRAVIELGSRCKIEKDHRQKVDNNETLSLQDLKSIKNTDSYLSEPPKKIYIYHSCHDARGEGLISMLIFATMQAKIFIIQPHAQAEQHTINFQKLIRDAHSKLVASEEYEQHEEVEELVSKLTFTCEYVDNREAAFESVQRELDIYQREKRGPTSLLVQSPYSIERLSNAIHILPEFPIITMASSDEDNRYPALGWIQFCTKILANRCLTVSNWLDTILQYSRYSKSPIGNIEPDFTVFLYDLIFARLLHQNDQVLWVSESNRPDLGGMQADDLHAIIASEEIHRNIQINHQGMYHGMCIEFELFKLDIDSVLQSQHVNDLEGTNYDEALLEVKEHIKRSNNDAQLDQVFDDAVLCFSAFRVLKSMVSALFSDVQEDENYLADVLLMSFYRWLRSSHAKLYDPSMSRMIYKLMKKVFLQLLSSLKKLGATIVYADFNRVVIATNRVTLADTKDYIQFITNSISKNNLFSWIELRPKRYFSHLLWYNSSNFAGVEWTDTTEEDNEDTEQMSDESNDGFIYNNWDLLNYLPAAVQQKFIIIVSHYIDQLRQLQNEFLSSSDKTISDEDLQEKLKKAAKTLIETQFTPQMLIQLDEIKMIESDKSASVDDKRLVVLKDSREKNFRLEFTKTICQILSMDKFIKSEVASMRSSMLRLLNVKEYSTEASFSKQVRSFVLPDVICSYCNSHTDIDICKIPSESKSNEFWKCFHCHNSYDKSVIEGRLLEYVEKRTVSYHVQDLKCEKCSHVKIDNLSTHCECSGKWLCSDGSDRVHSTLSTLSLIAKFYGFSWLQENLEWLGVKN